MPFLVLSFLALYTEVGIPAVVSPVYLHRVSIRVCLLNSARSGRKGAYTRDVHHMEAYNRNSVVCTLGCESSSLHLRESQGPRNMFEQSLRALLCSVGANLLLRTNLLRIGAQYTLSSPHSVKHLDIIHLSGRSTRDDCMAVESSRPTVCIDCDVVSSPLLVCLGTLLQMCSPSRDLDCCA